MLEFCFENNIVLCRRPLHMAHKNQSCDASMFGLLRTAWCNELKVLYRGGINSVRKEHFVARHSPAQKTALATKNIIAAWAERRLCPWIPGRVLKNIPELVCLIVAVTCGQIQISCDKNEDLDTPGTLQRLVRSIYCSIDKLQYVHYR